MNKKLHIGLSGWSYPEWKGTFYPEKMKSTDWLGFYARAFDTVEINSSFYRLPKLQTLENWADKVPANFKFCAKMSRYLTHIKRLKEPEEPLQRFFSVFAHVKKQLGPLLVQLPGSLAFDMEVAVHFFELLKRDYSEYQFAVEARHETWTQTEATRLLEEYNIAWVISQAGTGFPYRELITGDNIYIRLHGPEKLYASSYPDETLQYFADKIKAWQKEGHNIWAYFNNTWGGYALDNIKTLEEMLMHPNKT